MASSDSDEPRPTGWRVVVLALAFALVAHGCFAMATSLTLRPL